MKEIIFGTTNEAKIKQIKGALSPAGVIVEGIQNKESLPEVVEDGKTAVENARKKAIAYAKTLGKPVFSMDNALYLDGLPPEKQPGLNVRRINGYTERPTDEQMINYYSKLIASLGNRIDGYWEYGVCIAAPDGRYQETIIKTPRIYVSEPSSVIQNGYPLESLQIEPVSGKYMSELTQGEQDMFWQKAIGQPLLEFVQSVNL
ncbi:MAG TPA: non-canonical purine NTP pyrophosphatase [Patescibacteria group bacterium]|nr:non-canonical purine NTP pyrophosphatase [Patescibacteria group bacterium]